MLTSSMNKKLISRIYIVLALVWSAWWMYRYGDSMDGIMPETVLVNALAPIPLYFGIRWILNALDK